MNIEKIDWFIVKIKLGAWFKVYLLKRKLEQWFPTKYVFRVVRTRIVIEQRGENYVTPEHYDIIGSWDDQDRRFGKQILQGRHSLELPGHTDNGWTVFTYELQRRPSNNWDANWKSLGYLRFNRVS